MEPTAIAITVETTALATNASLQELLCRLHALYAIFRSAHWQVVGEAYYGDHLLFERLYSSLDGEIDKLAERMVGQFGAELVDADYITAGTDVLVQEWVHETPCPYERGQLAEQELLECAHRAMLDIEEAGLLTLGWEDFLGEMCNQHEEHMYLLGQRLQ